LFIPYISSKSPRSTVHCSNGKTSVNGFWFHVAAVDVFQIFPSSYLKVNIDGKKTPKSRLVKGPKINRYVDICAFSTFSIPVMPFSLKKKSPRIGSTTYFCYQIFQGASIENIYIYTVIHIFFEAWESPPKKGVFGLVW